MLITKLSNHDKILYQDVNITKLDLAHYFEKVSSHILPHIKDRPLTLVRCPSSGKAKCFYQKHWMEGTPEGIEMIDIPGKNSAESAYMMINSQSGLMAAAQLAVLEIHPWASRYDKLEQPDRIIFDLDPAPEVNWNTLTEAGRIVRDSLTALELKSFVKLTGGKGFHIVVPIIRKKNYSEIKEFCKLLSEKLALNFPNLFTAEISKKKRVNKIFIDYLRNEHEATAIAPFSPRSNPEASIAVPISWEALSTTTTSKEYSINTLEKYFQDYSQDPWKNFYSIKQSITQQHFQALKNIT